MNTKLVFVLMIIIGGVAIFGITANQKGENKTRVSEVQSEEQSLSETTLEAQYKNMGEVEVEIIPKQLAPDQNAIFEISLNTHSVDLSYDYQKIVTLKDNFGNTYLATDWTGGSGGHHLSGELHFDPLPADVKEITLNIDGINNEIASFSWNL